MLDFHQKRKVRGVIYNRITIGLLLLVVLFVARSAWVVYRKKVESEEMKDISFKNVEALRQRSIEIQYKIDRLATTQGIEEEVRSKFSVAKPDENMVVIVREESSTSETVKKSGFWQTVWGFFTKD